MKKKEKEKPTPCEKIVVRLHKTPRAFIKNEKCGNTAKYKIRVLNYGDNSEALVANVCGKCLNTYKREYKHNVYVRLEVIDLF